MMDLTVLSPTIVPRSNLPRPGIIAMVHVPVTSLLQNNCYTAAQNIPSLTLDELYLFRRCIAVVQRLTPRIEEHHANLEYVAPLRSSLRSLPLLYCFDDARNAYNEIEGSEVVLQLLETRCVQYLIQRAIHEVEVYIHRGGFELFEIENVGAPYFVGAGQNPMEELFIMLFVAVAIRNKFPTIVLGMHILSCNELEVLPIALYVGAYFVRSEATMFTGVRPEGTVKNDGNLARYLYVRNVLALEMKPQSELDPASKCRYCPYLWSDLKKKHTVFYQEFQDIDIWLHNIHFMKLEGVIVTGAETGSNVDELSLSKSRIAINAVKAFNRNTYLGVLREEGNVEGKEEEKNKDEEKTECQVAQPKTLPQRRVLDEVLELPLVTGSGLDFEMYAKYADYMIVGTALKRGGYWENEVDGDAVEAVAQRFHELQLSRSSK